MIPVPFFHQRNHQQKNMCMCLKLSVVFERMQQVIPTNAPHGPLKPLDFFQGRRCERCPTFAEARHQDLRASFGPSCGQGAPYQSRWTFSSHSWRSPLQPFKGSRELTIPKRSQTRRIARPDFVIGHPWSSAICHTICCYLPLNPCS